MHILGNGNTGVPTLSIIYLIICILQQSDNTPTTLPRHSRHYSITHCISVGKKVRKNVCFFPILFPNSFTHLSASFCPHVNRNN